MARINEFPYDLKESPNLYSFRYINPNLRRSRIPLINADLKEKYDQKTSAINQLFNNKRISPSYLFNVNISSRVREKTQQLLLGEQNDSVPKNPIQLEKGEKIATITAPDHGFTKGDFISLTNVSPIKFIIDNPFESRKGTSFVRIQFPGAGHGLTSKYIGLSNLYLQISNVTNSIGNFSPNILTGIFSLFLTCNYSQFPDATSQTNSMSSTFNPNFIYIQLFKTGTTYYSDLASNTNKNVSINFLFLGGIPLQFINTGINSNIYQQNPYLIVDSVINSNNFTIRLPRNSLTTNVYGGKNVKLYPVNKYISGYSNPNNYVIPLGKTYSNIIEVEMVSSEFPKATFNVMGITLINNKLYWNDINDTNDTTYSIALTPGKYLASELEKEIKTQFESVLRQPTNYPSYSSTFKNIFTPPNYHSCDVKIDLVKNIFQISSFIKTGLVNSFFISRISANETRLYIILQGNTAQVGQTIKITDAPNIGVIPSSAINGTHIINTINEQKSTGIINPFVATSITYLTGSANYTQVDLIRINLPMYNQTSNPNPATDTITYNYCPLLSEVLTLNVYIPDQIRLIFTTKDTLGNFLGFRRVGGKNDITEYSEEVTNSSLYQYEISTGSVTSNAIILQSITFIYICCPELSQKKSTIIEGPYPIANAVFKIQLSDKDSQQDLKNSYVFNSYTKSKINFFDPLAKLTELTLTFVDEFGNLYDFQNMDHSFQLKITTIEASPDEVDFSSRIGTIRKAAPDPTKKLVLTNSIDNPKTALRKIDGNY